MNFRYPYIIHGLLTMPCRNVSQLLPVIYASNDKGFFNNSFKVYTECTDFVCIFGTFTGAYRWAYSFAFSGYIYIYILTYWCILWTAIFHGHFGAYKPSIPAAHAAARQPTVHVNTVRPCPFTILPKDRRWLVTALPVSLSAGLLLHHSFGAATCDLTRMKEPTTKPRSSHNHTTIPQPSHSISRASNGNLSIHGWWIEVWGEARPKKVALVTGSSSGIGKAGSHWLLATRWVWDLRL